ncbi:PAS domain S-box protein, partial [Pseudoxanthomonas sp. SGD-10]
MMRLLCVFTLFFCLLTLNTYPQAKQEVRLQLKWHHQFQFAGYYAAKIKGFYEEEGLDVSIIEGSDKRSSLSEVYNGNVEFGITGADILYEYVKGKQLVVTSVIFQHSPYVFMTLKDANLRSPTDLHQKRVMVSNDQGGLLLRSLFYREGVALDSVKLIKHSWDNQDLIDKKVDAISAYSTVEPFQLQKAGHEVYLINPRDYGLDFYGDLIFTRKDYAQQNPEIVEAFNRASIKGWEYALSNKNEIISYILKMPGVSRRNIRRENLEFEAKGTEELIFSNLVEIGHINPGRFQNMLDVYKELGMVPSSVTIDGLIYKRRSLDWARVTRIVFISGGVAVFLLMLIFIWNRKLLKTVNSKTKELQNEIKQRKNAEQLARQSENRLKLAIRSANIGLWEWNLDTHELTASKEWCILLGLNPFEEPPMKLNILELVHPDDRMGILKIFNKSMLEIRRLSMHELRLVTKNDNEIYVLVSFNIVKSEQGSVKKLSGVIVNVDNIKKHEHALWQLSEKLLHTNKELKKFAYITSHNLRAPVVNIVSLTEMFDKSKLQGDNHAIFEKIEQSVINLNGTLNDLIEIISNSKNELPELQLISFKEVFEDVCRSISVELEKVNPHISLDFKVKELKYSKAYLESLFLNLVTNAIKYRDKNRRLRIDIK